MYYDLGLFERFRFPRRGLLEEIYEFNDDLQYLASILHLSAPVGGRSCTCDDDGEDVGLHVLGCRIDILGTNCNNCTYDDDDDELMLNVLRCHLTY